MVCANFLGRGEARKMALSVKLTCIKCSETVFTQPSRVAMFTEGRRSGRGCVRRYRSLCPNFARHSEGRDWSASRTS